MEAPIDLAKLEPTFENVTKQIFAVKCLSCHNAERARGKTDLETMEAILAKDELITKNPDDSKIVKRVLLRGKGQMPTEKSGISVLTPDQVDFVKRWIQASAAGLSQKPAIDFSKLELSFKNIQKEIYAPKCYTCHDGSNEEIWFNIDWLEGYKMLGIISDKAADSKLIRMVTDRTADNAMPPLDFKEGQPLTADEVDYLKRWIEAGAPE